MVSGSEPGRAVPASGAAPAAEGADPVAGVRLSRSESSERPWSLRLGLAIRPPLRRPRGAPPVPNGLDHVVELSRAAEDNGYDAFFLDGSPAAVLDGSPAAPDASGTVPALDPFVVLGAVAVSTSTIRLGCLAPAIHERPPALLAKVVSALDVCSDGRAVLGLAPDEAGAAGPEPSSVDLQRVGEALEVCRALLRVSGPSFSGAHYHLVRAFNEPRPSHLEGGAPIALEVPSALPEDLAAGLVELTARFAELCVLAVGTGEDPAARVGWALETLRPAARRAGREDGGPALVVRLPVAGLPPSGVAELVGASTAAGARGAIVDWGVARLDCDEVVSLAKILAEGS